MTKDWHKYAEQLQIKGFENRLFINGKFCSAQNGETFVAINPATDQKLTDIAQASAKDVDDAVFYARQAFNDGRWRLQSPMQRKTVLLKFAQLIEDHADELALLETLDVGKPICDSLNVDLPSVIRCARWYAEAIDKIYGEIAPTSHKDFATIIREPLGVVAIIVPWNFPLLMAMWKLAPALAAGNSVLLKPAEQSSLSALKLAHLAQEAGIPDGVFNVLTGDGAITGQAMGLHNDIDGAFFTGSTFVGKKFLVYSGQSNLKKVGLECGGKSAHIIMDSCQQLDNAAETAIDAIFFNQGQMCTAGARLIVHKNIHNQVIDRLLYHAQKYKPNDPLLESTNMGSLVSAEHCKNVLNYIEIGKKESANLVWGGNQLQRNGYFVEPTIFDNVDPKMRIAQEEIFGPVLSVITIDTMEEAIHVANDTVYGLASAIWSDNINEIYHMAQNIQAGMIYLNCYDADDITVPFGGYKQSGIGRDKSLHAFDKYTEIKTCWLKLSDQI